MGFTKDQKQAIDARSGNYVVSASAGAGKTAVLTERVFNLIKEGSKLSELLILTFTNLAASQMRDRIRQKLVATNEAKFIEIAASLDAANIQTYDAFALNLVKKYHDRLNLPENVGLVDSSLFKIEKNKIINRIFTEGYENEDKDILKLVDEFCYRSTDEIKSFIVSLSDEFELIKNKSDYLNNYENIYLNDNFINKLVDEFLHNIRSKFTEIIKRVKTFENTEYIDANLPILEKLANFKCYEELQELLVVQNLGVDSRGKKSLKGYEDDKNYHDYIGAFLKTLKEQIVYKNKENIVKQYLGTKDNIITILSIIKKLDDETNSFKFKYSSYSFIDIFKFAMKLTDIEDVKNEIKNRFKYIMIDEYQDTSDLQEEFISAISNNNVYVVGDIKQSIYRFRNANCQIFLDKYNKYAKKDGGELINLQENFRSRSEVIDTVNRLFGEIMNLKSSDLDYKNSHKMIAGNKSFITEKDSNYETELISYRGEDLNDYGGSKHEFEAKIIATDIKKKVLNKYKIYDQNTRCLRDCKYSDFAILISVKTNFTIYQKVFNDYGIPLFANYEKTIRDNDLTYAFQNIVKLIAMSNGSYTNKNYKHCFISVMRSFITNDNDEDVEIVATSNKFSRSSLFAILEKTIAEVKGKSLKEHLIIIAKNFNIYKSLINVGDVSNGISILEYYFNIASQMDKMGYSIDDLVMYFDDLDKFDIEPSFVGNDDVEDAVKLLTIHASKGLQFKICYFPDLDHHFNFDSLKGKFLYSKKYGISVPNVYSDEVFSLTKNLIVEDEKIELIKEETRLAYVAFTRPEEKIILVGDLNKRSKPVQDFYKCRSFMDFFNFYDLSFNETHYEILKFEKLHKKKEILKNIEIKPTPKMSDEVIEISHASKQLDDSTNSELLRIGNKYHYYLEILDFSSKDVSFIKNEKDRKIIAKFVLNSIFGNAKEAKILHEYPFFDEKNNVNGVIDLLLIYSDHIDIVDFKLSHVDDELYVEQVKKYKNYISQLSTLPIHTYITGILSGDIKKVD